MDTWPLINEYFSSSSAAINYLLLLKDFTKIRQSKFDKRITFSLCFTCFCANQQILSSDELLVLVDLDFWQLLFTYFQARILKNQTRPHWSCWNLTLFTLLRDYSPFDSFCNELFKSQLIKSIFDRRDYNVAVKDPPNKTPNMDTLRFIPC